MKKTTQEIIKQIIEGKKGHEFMSTGFNKLDMFLDGGFFKKELIVVGAHTGIGKSLLAGHLFYNIAKQGYKSAYFSLEISNEMVLSRILGAIANIKPTRVRYASLEVSEHQKKLEAEAEMLSLDDLVTFYDDLYTFDEIAKEVICNKYEFVVVDFIQNMLDQIPDEYSRLSKISIQLQKLAKSTGCTFLILSQLSNTAAKSGNDSKVLEYKGSGSIATVCDLGFFLDRDWKKSTQINSNEVSLMLRKNRRGPAGQEFVLRYNDPGGRLDES